MSEKTAHFFKSLGQSAVFGAAAVAVVPAAFAASTALFLTSFIAVPVAVLWCGVSAVMAAYHGVLGAAAFGVACAVGAAMVGSGASRLRHMISNKWGACGGRALSNMRHRLRQTESFRPVAVVAGGLSTLVLAGALAGAFNTGAARRTANISRAAVTEHYQDAKRSYHKISCGVVPKDFQRGMGC